MILQLLILIIGFIVLIKGADLFVDSSSNLARHFKISKMVIGLTIVAFGTSAPEFAVSVKSIISNSADITLGNVLGSNILNICLILGLSSVIHDLTVKTSTVKKEIPILLLLTSALITLMSDKIINGVKDFPINILSRGEGLILILLFGIFIYHIFSMIRRKNDVEEDEIIQMSLKKSIVLTIVGIVAIILGSNFVVDSSVKLASTIGISQKIISLTIIAIGTSLPELVTSIIATKKGEYDIAIGNVVGSNIFNIGMVLGIPVALFGNLNVNNFSNIDSLFVLLSALLLQIFSFRKYKITKIEGLILLLMYILYTILIFI